MSKEWPRASRYCQHCDRHFRRACVVATTCQDCFHAGHRNPHTYGCEPCAAKQQDEAAALDALPTYNAARPAPPARPGPVRRGRTVYLNTLRSKR